jgi:hypothetical protein
MGAKFAQHVEADVRRALAGTGSNLICARPPVKDVRAIDCSLRCNPAPVESMRQAA